MIQPTDSLHAFHIIDYANEFSIGGALLSLIGLFLSLYVVYTARKINQFIFYNRRLPQLLRKIDTHATSISELVRDFDSSHDSIREEMVRCSANVHTLRKHMARPQKKLIDSLSTLIAGTVKKTDLTKASVRDVYLQLRYLTEHFDDIQKDFITEK